MSNIIERGVYIKPESGNPKDDIENFDDKFFMKKLYITKDTEGKRNKEIIDAVKELYEELEEQDPKIVGIAPYGSVVRGYNVKGKSDLDVRVLYDDPEEVNEKEWEVNNKIITDETQKAFDKIHKQKDLPPTEIAADLLNINPELTDRRGNLNYYRNIEAYAPIFLVVTGKKIDYYREYWAKRVSEMSEDKRNKFINNSVHWLTHYAEFNPYKLAERAHISREKLGEIMDAREELWRKRVKRLLKIG